MSDLAVPQHIEAERKAQKEAQKIEESKTNGEASIQDAYIEPQERVLDPSLIDSSLLERMPDPTGWRLLVLPYKGKEQGLQINKSEFLLESLFPNSRLSRSF